MKRSNKAEDFVRLMKSKQEIEIKIESQRKLSTEKSMTPQDFNKFKMEIFKDVSELLTKMNSWIGEGMSKEDISWFLAFLKEKKDDRITFLMEDAKQTYITEVNGYYKRRIKNQDEIFKKILDVIEIIKESSLCPNTMYQAPNSTQPPTKTLKLQPNQQFKPSSNNFFYNPLGQNSGYPAYKPQTQCYQTAINNSMVKNHNPQTNVSGNASTEYSTPRMVVSSGINDEFVRTSQGKTNPRVKLNHLFGTGQRSNIQAQKNSFLSNASSHESEENMLRMNTSFTYNNNPGQFCFPSINNLTNPNSYPLQDCRVKSLHISSKNTKKIEEQEEKDDEDFILNISKYYINNVEEDPNEIIQVMKDQEEKKNLEKNKAKSNMVFEITSRNKLDFPRRKKNFPEGNSTKYDIDIGNIENDGRTTLMIKNIPNKYDLDSILANLRRNHAYKYDFFYLPIDFNNKCNVGYAFINFVHTKFIADFYLEFNGRKWEKFNSEKICLIKYARIQGLEALISHFQFSSVMNKKDKNVRPVIIPKNELGSIEKLVQMQKTQNNQKKN